MNISITGPSGVGKTTLVKALASKEHNIIRILSTTTRPPRAQEEEGEDYFFVSKAHWAERSWALVTEFQGNFYGVPSELLEPSDALHIFNLDELGAKRLRTIDPQCLNLLLLPPSPQSLHERLHMRGESSDSPRFQEKMIWDYEAYHHIVINDVFETCVDSIYAYLKPLIRTT